MQAVLNQNENYISSIVESMITAISLPIEQMDFYKTRLAEVSTQTIQTALFQFGTAFDELASKGDKVYIITVNKDNMAFHKKIWQWKW